MEGISGIGSDPGLSPLPVQPAAPREEEEAERPAEPPPEEPDKGGSVDTYA